MDREFRKMSTDKLGGKKAYYASKVENKTLVTTQKMVAHIAKHPDCNTYMPLSAWYRIHGSIAVCGQRPQFKAILCALKGATPWFVRRRNGVLHTKTSRIL